MEAQCSFNLHFVMAETIELSLLCLLAFCTLHFENCLFIPYWLVLWCSDFFQFFLFSRY